MFRLSYEKKKKRESITVPSMTHLEIALKETEKFQNTRIVTRLKKEKV